MHSQLFLRIFWVGCPCFREQRQEEEASGQVWEAQEGAREGDEPVRVQELYGGPEGNLINKFTFDQLKIIGLSLKRPYLSLDCQVIGGVEVQAQEEASGKVWVHEKVMNQLESGWKRTMLTLMKMCRKKAIILALTLLRRPHPHTDNVLAINMAKKQFIWINLKQRFDTRGGTQRH